MFSIHERNSIELDYMDHWSEKKCIQNNSIFRTESATYAHCERSIAIHLFKCRYSQIVWSELFAHPQSNCSQWSQWFSKTISEYNTTLPARNWKWRKTKQIGKFSPAIINEKRITDTQKLIIAHTAQNKERERDTLNRNGEKILGGSILFLAGNSFNLINKLFGG